MADIHVSLDLETLSTRPDAVILSIGAAAMVDGELTTFVTFCNVPQNDRHVEPATIDWWMKQGDLWRQTQDRAAEAPSLEIGLNNLQTWLASLGGDDDKIYVWGNGANFDLAILEHAYKSLNRQPPWAYWATRDLRTLKHLAEEKGIFKKPERVGTHHDAVDDAVFQLQVILDHWPQLVG